MFVGIFEGVVTSVGGGNEFVMIVQSASIAICGEIQHPSLLEEALK